MPVEPHTHGRPGGAVSRSASPIGERCRGIREPLDWSMTPERAALLLRGAPAPFALVGKWAGGGALLGSDPVAEAGLDEDPFAVLERQPATVEAEPGPLAGAPFVGGGWFGFLGYGLGSLIERLDPAPPGARPVPAFRLAFYDHVVRMDADGGWWFEALVTDSRSEALADRVQALRMLGEDVPSPRAFQTEPWVSTPRPAGHALAVEACRERIRAGDLFQANICMRLDSRISGDPLDLFVTGAERLQPDRAAYVAGDGWALASLSPELFLERRGAQVRTVPIKGTRPRPPGAAEAERQRLELAGSDKDLAENRMILDMARNDLGRVCDYGSVRVTYETETRPHAGVWHLVSEVCGELHPSRGDRDLLRATFPPASVTGAPKIASQNVIAELESAPRGAYTGAIGFAAPLAGLELSVAIRTFEFAGEQARLGLGGGIVSDSDPAAEAEECHTKAAPLLAVIDAEPAGDGGGATSLGSAGGSASTAPPPQRLGPRPVPRPDPSAGLFETIRVDEGRPEHLDLHLERLAASLDELYGAPVPEGLGEEIEATASSLTGLWRLRVDLVAEGATDRGRVDFEHSVTCHPAASRSRPSQPLALRPVTVPGGLGPHKWRDRRLLEALGEHVAPAMPLLCDLDGYLLEAERANVFLLLPGGVAVTPPLDGRILPGVTRRRLVEDPALLGRLAGGPAGAGPTVDRVEKRPIHLSELETGGELVITSAISVVEPARLSHLRPTSSV